ncbi:MAG: Smr/MutS family protein [Desulfatiglandales bacterium]
MRGKRKKGRIDQAKNRVGENKKFLNKPLKGLIKVLDEDSNQRTGPVSSPCLPDRTAKEGDQDLFQMAMKDVIPLRDNKDKIIRPPVKKDKSSDQLHGHKEMEREYLSYMLEEPAAWDISFSDEYMEGAVSGVGPRIMKRLKRGEFSIQEYIDLHGLTRKEAEDVVNKFIIQSYQKGLRCVLIVHGRGLRSVDHKPAIKKELPVWFKRGVLKKIVLAFVTARPCDGGAGALYVLLKKR